MESTFFVVLGALCCNFAEELNDMLSLRYPIRYIAPPLDPWAAIRLLLLLINRDLGIVTS